MAIKITEDGVVRYENEPNIDRELFPNTAEGTSPEQIAEAVADWIEEHPEVVSPVQDVQVGGTSILDAHGVANVPFASTQSAGVVRMQSVSYGIQITESGYIGTYPATESGIKSGVTSNQPVTPFRQHLSTFYGLAKAAGDTTQSASDNPVGSYTADAKTAIQIMLGISNIIGNVEGATASTAYSVGDLFLHSGALYEATAAIASGDAIVPGTNCEQTTIIDILKGV